MARGFTGGYTTVKNYVREHGLRSREMFVPLAHAPGHAQADFGEAMVVIARRRHWRLNQWRTNGGSSDQWRT